jgi:hypothetical protein
MGFFLNDHCPWTDTKDNEAIYRAIILPTIVVRDFWMSPAVHIVTEMRSLGLKEEELLELILIGGYQTLWFRFFLHWKNDDTHQGTEVPLRDICFIGIGKIWLDYGWSVPPSRAAWDQHQDCLLKLGRL